MSMRRYADVITEANKIVSASAPFVASTGVAHALQSDYRTMFTSNYTTTESILSMPFATNETPGGQNQLGYYYGPSAFNGGNGEYSLLPIASLQMRDGCLPTEEEALYKYSVEKAI